MPRRALASILGRPKGRPLDPKLVRALKVAGYLAGLAMLVAALAVAFTQDGGRVTAALRATPLADIVLLAMLSVASAAIVSSFFWVITAAFGRVGFTEMLALVGGAWLLNYLPMRPGLVGRVAYHKRFNSVPVRDSVRVLAINGSATLACSVHAGVVGLASVLGAGRVELVALVLVPMLGWAGLLARFSGKSLLKGVALWRCVVCVALHYADVAVWAARYAVACSILDITIDADAAFVLAAASQFAFLIPFAGNGLGVREWTMGLLVSSGVLGIAAAPTPGDETPITDENTPSALSLGVEIELVNRGAELAASVPAGLAGLAFTAWFRRRGRPTGGPGRNAPGDSPRQADPPGPISVESPSEVPTDGQQDRTGPPTVPTDRPRQDPKGPPQVPHP